jgi:hypothetical protein
MNPDDRYKGGCVLKKEEIIAAKLQIAVWADSLKSISEELWVLPFREGSWGIADVIAHFISWDRFIIENRVSYLLKNQTLPKMDIDENEINRAASQYARSGIMKGQLIDEFISTRQRLVSLLEELSSERFTLPLPGMEHTTLGEYFVSMIEHDLKHKAQIEKFIQQKF